MTSNHAKNSNHESHQYNNERTIYVNADADTNSDATLTDCEPEPEHEPEYEYEYEKNHRDQNKEEYKSPYSILPTDEDRETIINDAIDELAVVARENILEFKREDFDTEEVVGTWIDSYLCQYFAELDPFVSNYSTATAAEAASLNDVMDAYIGDLYDEIAERFYDEIAPPRVSLATHNTTLAATDSLTAKIQTLREKPQPDQRTPEWYARRNNLITASAASKAFGSQSSINQLIYEKCKNYAGGGGGVEGDSGIPMQGPVNSPLHWGQRYEPVTVMVYEHRNRTKLGEFGCIQHDLYPFIGASPDGINIDPSSPIYGRMVEIKNIFNREITGHPKEEYWVQTQIQMEVCDLDECDFVETRFKEYEDEEEYLADTGNGPNEKGIILWFQSAPTLNTQGHVSQPIQLYEYAPIGYTGEEYEKWEAEVFAKHEQARDIWVRTIYWRLDQYSCVLIRRNRLWFSEAVKLLQNVWTTIENERKSGYEHRAPKRKTLSSKDVAATTGFGGGGSSGAGGGTENGTVFKIVKLDTAIIPETEKETEAETETETTGCPLIATKEVTATNMATLMSFYNNNNNNKKSGGRNSSVKRPSDVLINCFKIDELEIDESKVE
jgi:putative phage-type endonuclease